MYLFYTSNLNHVRSTEISDEERFLSCACFFLKKFRGVLHALLPIRKNYIFLTAREKDNTNIKEKHIFVAIYINLINTVNAFTNLEIDFIFSIGNYYK